MQKVYVTEEDKEKFMEKVNRDVEVGALAVATVWPGGGSTSGWKLQAVVVLTRGLVFASAVPGEAEDHGLQSAAGHPRRRPGRAGGGRRGGLR